MRRCGSLPGSVGVPGSRRGSAAPDTRIAWYTSARPESGSRIAPPRQVAAPPYGSISVGWLCVSFLNSTSHGAASAIGSARPGVVAEIRTVHALISAENSTSGIVPSLRRQRIIAVARSMRVTGRSVSPRRSRSARYHDQLSSTARRMAAASASSVCVVSDRASASPACVATVTESRRVRKVVCRQWSDQ